MRKTYQGLVRGSIGVSLLALAAASPARAEAEAEDASDILVTGERAVSATKTDTPILRIPQSINIVSEQQIEDTGSRTIVEALSYTAGVASGTDDSRGDFNNVRGFESVLYIDGLKRNYGFVFLPRADVNVLERIEVLVGPASVLYGAGSSGGLTNMVSKKPKFEFGGTASVSYGTYNRKEGVVDVYGPLTETLAARFVGVLRDSDSQIDYVPNKRVVAQGALTWKPTPDTNITAIGLYQRDNNGPNYNVAPLVASLLAPTPERRIPNSRFLGEPGQNDKGFKRNTTFTLLGSHDFSDAIRFASSTVYVKAYTDQREAYINTYAEDPLSPTGFTSPLDPFVDAANEVVARSFFGVKVHYKTFNTDNNIGFKVDVGGISQKILVGVDYSYFRLSSSQAYTGSFDTINIYNPVYGNGPAPVYFPATQQVLKQLGFYAQDQIDFGEVASLVLGFRRDRYTKSETTALTDEKTRKVTKRAGLTINVTKQIAPYVSYSESFLPVAGLNQFGSTYVPLLGKQKEVGVKWQPRLGTMVRASYYSLKEENALRPDPDNPLDSVQSGFTKATGYEFQLNHEVAKDLTFAAAYSHSKIRQSGEDHLRDNTPRTIASATGTKTFALSEDLTLRVGAGVRYVSKQFSREGTFLVRTPSFTLMDGMASLEYGSWKFQVNALNLLDESYYPTCYARFCSNGAGREIQGALTYSF